MLNKSHRSVVSTCVLIFIIIYAILKKKKNDKNSLKKNTCFFFEKKKNTIWKKLFFFSHHYHSVIRVQNNDVCILFLRITAVESLHIRLLENSSARTCESNKRVYSNFVPWCQEKKFRLSYFCKKFSVYTVHIDWCYHSIYKHTSRSQHAVMHLGYMISGRHRRSFEGQHLVWYWIVWCSIILTCLIIQYFPYCIAIRFFLLHHVAIYFDL